MFHGPRKGRISIPQHRGPLGEEGLSDVSVSLHRPGKIPVHPYCGQDLQRSISALKLKTKLPASVTKSLENPSRLSSFLRSPRMAFNTLRFSAHPHSSPSSPRSKGRRVAQGRPPPAPRSPHQRRKESGNGRAPRRPAPSERGGSGCLEKRDRAPPGRARMRQRPRREWRGCL